MGDGNAIFSSLPQRLSMQIHRTEFVEHRPHPIIGPKSNSFPLLTPLHSTSSALAGPFPRRRSLDPLMREFSQKRRNWHASKECSKGNCLKVDISAHCRERVDRRMAVSIFCL
jgi:hypothetical protein